MSTDSYNTEWYFIAAADTLPTLGTFHRTPLESRETAALPAAAVFGGPVYSSGHWLRVWAPGEAGLRWSAGDESKDLRIQFPAFPSFILWNQHKKHKIMSNSLHRFLFTVCAALFVLPSFEGASLFKVLLFNGLVCGSTLRSAADDRSKESLAPW